jgi:cbb3-type cytochrome oxidase subunit 1
MEVSSPTFAAGKARPGESTGRSSAVNAAGQTPSASLPLRFVVTGLLALGAGVLWLVVRPDLLATYHYNQYVIAVTHLFTLGAITSIIMGAMYQLVPVALETQLYSERLARWQFTLHLVGVAGMVWMFWVWNLTQVGHFGSFVGLGMLMFAYNLGRTLKQSPRRNVITFGIAAALFWLVLTMVAGLYLAAAKCW